MRIGLILAIAAFAIDQLHKWYMLYIYGIAAKGVVQVTPFFDLVLVWNKGISYGLFSESGDVGRWIFVAFAAVAIIFLLIWLSKEPGTLVSIAIGLVIGGAAGNVVDRLAYGAVADFFSFHMFGFYWYVFNIADVAIVVGVAILIYDSFFSSHKTAT